MALSVAIRTNIRRGGGRIAFVLFAVKAILRSKDRGERSCNIAARGAILIIANRKKPIGLRGESILRIISALT